ncbi:hypothetical protein FF011L_45400 [Roseimaritima multifibrata]|uniref:Uncharacterized protein n=1 Tax=Roseimaritima multifibrata TaxID=1930274 RepID=A0A517MLK7_9BACT|nr:hypothetical protein [Roseimaritima multifibrata]QDS95740.1 hypothetical protein FF011L_45400 [Roseimaritima multifibrata]
MTVSSGTLLWIGNSNQREFVEAFEYCQRFATQLAWRADFADAIARPADGVTNILAARHVRQLVASEFLSKLEQIYPLVPKTLLVGSGCEGEGRTGVPFPGWQRLPWHAWQQVVPGWFGPPDSAVAAGSATGMTLVVSANYLTAVPFLELLTVQNRAAVWASPETMGTVRGASHVIWDDSAAPAGDPQRWRDRLAGVSTTAGVRHAWIVNYPRWEQMQAAKLGGVDTVLSKPFRHPALLRFLDIPRETSS